MLFVVAKWAKGYQVVEVLLEYPLVRGVVDFQLTTCTTFKAAVLIACEHLIADSPPFWRL